MLKVNKRIAHQKEAIKESKVIVPQEIIDSINKCLNESPDKNDIYKITINTDKEIRCVIEDELRKNNLEYFWNLNKTVLFIYYNDIKISGIIKRCYAELF